MIKEFIPYEQDLALKELGFDEPCLIKDTEQGEDCAIYYEHENGRPTFSQAFRWFRDKHNLVVVIQTVMKDSWLLTIESIDSTTASGVYNGKRWELDNDENYVDPKFYEEAELLCLKKLIEIVKSKK